MSDPEIPDLGRLYIEKTERDLLNMATFGICRECGTPRETRKTVTETQTTLELVCPNGHPQE